MFATVWIYVVSLILWNIPSTLLDTNVASLKSLYTEPMIVYPDGVSDERGVGLCHRNSVCNVVHKRFWFSNLVVRICRCIDKSECPWEWQDNDEHTMYINPRAQLKFCSPVNTLPKCKPQTEALTSIIRIKNNELESHIIEPRCYCDNFNYFERTSYKSSFVDNTTLVTTQAYQCNKLSKCQSKQFCGHITENLFQTYYVCTCPQHHLCLMENRKKHQTSEILFEGEAYKGICLPWQKPK